MATVIETNANDLFGSNPPRAQIEDYPMNELGDLQH
jgi:hypothetical protein